MSGTVYAGDSVEIKITIHPDSVTKARRVLQLTEDDAHRGHVLYLDTPGDRFYKNDLVVRVRWNDAIQGDVVVKIRPFDGRRLDARRWKHLEIDYDRIGHRMLRAATLGKHSDVDLVDEIIGGKKPRKVVTGEMKDLIRDWIGPRFEIDWDSLEVVGPASELYWPRVKIGDWDKKWEAEFWTLKDRSRVLEVSRKVPRESFRKLEKRCLSELQQLGIDASPSEKLKTDRVYDAEKTKQSLAK